MVESADDVARRLTSQEFVSALDGWRAAHPKATLREIELAVDEQLAKVRAELVSDLAQRSALQDISQLPDAERPWCERCREPLISRGKRRRTLKGPGNEEVSLDRSYAVCPRCDLGLFPPR